MPTTRHQIRSPYSSAALRTFILALGGLPRRPAVSHLPFQAVQTAANVIVGGTWDPMAAYKQQMLATARASGAAVLVARHGMNVRPFQPIFFDVVAQRGSGFEYWEEYLPCLSDQDVVWLMPMVEGPFIKLHQGGLHTQTEKPFTSPDEAVRGMIRANLLLERLTKEKAL